MKEWPQCLMSIRTQQEDSQHLFKYMSSRCYRKDFVMLSVILVMLSECPWAKFIMHLANTPIGLFNGQLHSICVKDKAKSETKLNHPEKFVSVCVNSHDKTSCPWVSLWHADQIARWDQKDSTAARCPQTAPEIFMYVWVSKVTSWRHRNATGVENWCLM